MQGLLLRLSTLDAGAENAVRVIEFFDRLIEGRFGLDAVIRQVAQLTECPVGVGGPVPDDSITRELEDGTVVWLARATKPWPLDAMVLERLTLAAAVLLDYSRLPSPALGDPALLELALSDSAGELDRSRALQLLGLAPATKVRVVAVKDDESVTPKLMTDKDIPPQRGLVGISDRIPAIEAPDAWRTARTAVRFATMANPIVYAESLGATLLFAQLSRAEIARHPDVIALDKIASELDMLNAVCATNSIRQAAAMLHRHHSTIAPRLEHAEPALGFPIDTSDGRFRLRVALVLRQLRDNG